jgi:hypothetical protein
MTRSCNHFVRATHYIVDKANREHPTWLAIRVSYGMNGILMRSADLHLLSKYLREGTARLPPDLLWQVASPPTAVHKFTQHRMYCPTPAVKTTRTHLQVHNGSPLQVRTR